MIFRGKDKLAEALKNGLLNNSPKTVQKKAPLQISEASVAIVRPEAKETVQFAASALKPNKPAWAVKLHEANVADMTAKSLDKFEKTSEKHMSKHKTHAHHAHQGDEENSKEQKAAEKRFCDVAKPGKMQKEHLEIFDKVAKKVLSFKKTSNVSESVASSLSRQKSRELKESDYRMGTGWRHLSKEEDHTVTGENHMTGKHTEKMKLSEFLRKHDGGADAKITSYVLDTRPYCDVGGHRLRKVK